MVIRQLFSTERNPTRPLNEVVNAEVAIDPRSEIDEYVFTEHTRDYLRTLIEGMLDTAQGVMPDCLRGWIAGFFGSGKSHFLKLAGALLENRPLEVGGRTVPALEYAVRRHSLDLPWQRLAGEFKTRAVTVNLAMAHGGSIAAQRRPLFYRLASEINRAWGYSAVPHVAAIEREIQRARKWKAFLDAVRESTQAHGDHHPSGRPYEWTDSEIRDFASEAHRVLEDEDVLPKVLPKYQKPREYLRDREAEQPSPESVVDLAVELARSLHADLGRVILCVDEVALYLKGGATGFDADRVREVQGLAEVVRARGQGKVFLLATAQLRVDTIDSAFKDMSGYVVFLRDRFPRGGRLELEERDIDTVVRERWLRKDPAAPDYAILERLVRDHAGLLARATKLRDENLIRDADRLTDRDAVLAYYPCLPYQVRLLQSVLEALRGEQQIDQAAAQSRALLTAVRSLFVPQNGANLAEAEIGTLVTFDRVYDVIRDVVRKADSATDRWITETIEQQLGSVGDVRISSVAKVIFLLQHLNPRGAPRRIHVSAENVAALLYPRLGSPWEPHLAAVREACQKLHGEHFVGEEPDTGYRFYRPEEQTFQKSVDTQPVNEGELRKLITGLIEEELKVLGTGSVPVSGGHKLDVATKVHVGTFDAPDPNARAAGLELHVVWPPPTSPQQIRVWTAQYAAAPHAALWVLPAAPEIDDLARRVLKLTAAIEDYGKRHGTHAVDFLRGEQQRLDTLRDNTLRAAVRQGIASSTILHRGVDTVLAGSGRKPQEVFRDTMKQAVAQVFPQLEDGAVEIKENELRRVLTWRPPQPQPEFFASLKLFDADGHPLVDRPFLNEIALALQGRPETDRTGKAVVSRLGGAPWGWPERAVKAGLGVLLRGRRLVVRLAEGGAIRSETDARAEAWLTGTQLFNRSVLELSELAVTPTEREQLTRLFADAFQAPGRDTMEKLEQAARDVLPAQLAWAREALADLRGRQLPGTETVERLVRVLDAATEPELAVGRLKQLAAHAAGAVGSDGVAVLARMATLVQAVAGLRARGQLDLLAAIRARAIGFYSAWDSTAAGGLQADLAALRQQVTEATLLTQADLAVERDARIFEAYAKDYRARHGARHERAAAALARLKEHPGWAKADGATRERLNAGIRTLDCASAATLVAAAAPDGRCPECRASLTELRTHLELIESREERAIAELDTLVAPPPRPSEAPIVVELEIQSADDLPTLHQRIDAVAQEALTRPRRVRITFEAIDG